MGGGSRGLGEGDYGGVKGGSRREPRGGIMEGHTNVLTNNQRVTIPTNGPTQGTNGPMKLHNKVSFLFS